MLLYGGAIQSAGAVKAKGEQRRATSDFMELEQERGISISSTVLSYEYRDKFVSILDTPDKKSCGGELINLHNIKDLIIELMQLPNYPE